MTLNLSSKQKEYIKEDMKRILSEALDESDKEIVNIIYSKNEMVNNIMENLLYVSKWEETKTYTDDNLKLAICVELSSKHSNELIGLEYDEKLTYSNEDIKNIVKLLKEDKYSFLN